MNESQVFGQKGEILAAKYLKKHGYKIIERNYKCKIGEVDIIAKHNGVLVFVEVKSRNSMQFGRPAEAVDEYKQRKLAQLATYYINLHKLYDVYARFDIIEVLGDKINLIQNAWTL